MVASQPGTVASFDPVVTLSGFSAGSRDRFMFNENQLVLAKLQQPSPIFATARSRSTDGTYTDFDNYRNLEGKFAYIDGSFQALNTTGVPTSDVHQIEIGFDQQITTDTIVFWSTSFVDTDLIFVEYSFDNNTWFDAGTFSWVQEFDDTIAQFPGDDPPTGEFKYTGTRSSGDLTARYWRIRGDAEASYVSDSGSNPNKTVTVDSTDFFDTSGTVYAVGSGSDVTITYTGTTSTTFTGADVQPDSLAAGYTIFSLYAFGNGVTEVQILQTLNPILEHWNSDGSQAVTNAVEGSQYYDMAYDKNDDVYYAIKFDDSVQGASINPDDDFNADTGANFDTSRWVEDTTNVYFQHNTVSGTLDLVTSAGNGQLSGNYGIDGDFVADIELVGAFEINDSAFFALEAKKFSGGNQEMVSVLRGPYTPGSDTSGIFGGATVTYSDTVAGAAELQDFRIRPENFDFGFAGGEVEYELTYVASSDHYTVTASGISHSNADPGVPYTMDSAAFTVSNLSTPADGQGFTITVRCAESSISGTAASGINLQLERIGTNGYARFDDTDVPDTYTTLHVGNVTTDRIRPQLYGSPQSQSISVSADNFSITGGTVFYDTPVFSVVTINKDGDLEQVASVSDSSGNVIEKFDVIRNPQAGYNTYLAPRVSIATNGADVGSGGEIYIKVNDVLYKYLKTALPLSSDNGAGASALVSGTIPSTGITNFAYNGYTQGGLSYVEYDSDLSGTFVRSIKTTDLQEVAFKAKLDVGSINFPFAWNVSDLATLYFVDNQSLKLYDLNETKAGFVNVTSDKQVLAAGTGEAATITAQVLNVYGEPKSAKTMSFSITAGDGAISPATGCSDGSGEDTTTYTVGSAVGTASITVSVSDIVCTP